MLKIFHYGAYIYLLCLQTTLAYRPSSTNHAKYAQSSPIWLKNIHGPKIIPYHYPIQEARVRKDLVANDFQLKTMNQYPEPDQQPSVHHPEVQAVLRHIDFSKVPAIHPRKVNGWNLDTAGYDAANDPDCWWSATVCKEPKIKYIPKDLYMCPRQGDWGLNYDDGPYKSWWPETEKDKEYDQPRLYNFLKRHGKQKATLFYVGSNVLRFPAAAVRALGDGHVLCSHTWSHPQMTTLTNQEIVAQLYWTQKVMKESTGVTPKCWRPPYGDVDDRVRAIAWQMGMRTILWDQDSFDWNLSSEPTVIREVNGYFKNWINARKNGTDNEHGHVTLQHENSNYTILLSEKWLPRIQKTFKVMPIHQCNNDPQPYWEKAWVYPTLDQPEPTKAIDKEIKIIDKAVPRNVETPTSASISQNPLLSLIVFITVYLLFTQ